MRYTSQFFKDAGKRGGEQAAKNMSKEELSARGKKAVKARELKRKNNLKSA